MERNAELQPELGVSGVPHWQNGRVDQVREARPHEATQYLVVRTSWVLGVCVPDGVQE